MIQFSPIVERKLYQALKKSFPDAKVSNDDILALAVCVRHFKKKKEAIPSELEDIDLDPYEAALEESSMRVPADQVQTLHEPDDDYRYYWVEAVHTRRTPLGFEPFVGHLGMVRVTLPTSRPRIFRTAFGRVTPSDHLIDTVYEANQKYSAHLGYPIKRLDLITPARQNLRFGAISVMLGYRGDADAEPSCYILEAGTATGQPKVLYLGKHLGASINAYSGYRPTPFACPSHAYLGTLTVKDGDEPDQLEISSRAIEGGVSQQPYINVSIQWTRQRDTLKNIWPGFILAQATAIVLSRSMKKTISTQCDEHTPGPKHA